MSDAGLTLQGAVYAALVAVPDIGAGVYDHVPQTAAYPHIEIGGGTGMDWSAALMRGEEHMLDIHVWSRYEGYAQARTIMAEVKNRLHEVTLTLSGAALVDIRWEDSDLFIDADGVTKHGVMHFRANTTI